MSIQDLPAHEENIRRRVLLPFTLTLLLGLGFFFALAGWHLQRDITSHVDQQLHTVAALHARLLAQRVEVMGAALAQIAHDAGLRQAMASGDREALLQQARRINAPLAAEHNITHFYLHRPDGTVLLRVHRPERYGDRIDRITLRSARETGRPSAGLEPGPLGTFTLRLVVPWNSGAEVLGYLELGEDIDRYIKQLAEVTHAELVVALGPDSAGMLQKSESPVRVGDHLLIDETLPGLARQAAAALDGRGLMPGGADLDLEFGGRSYRGRFLPLAGPDGNRVAQLLVLEDVSDRLTDFRRMTALMLGGCLLLGGGMFATSFVVLGRAQRQLGGARRRLLDEIAHSRRVNDDLAMEVAHRQQAELALQDANDQLEQRVAERTCELDRRNRLLAGLIANVPYGVAWKDARSVYRGCNPRFCDLLGLAADAIIGSSDAGLAWPPSLRSLLHELEAEIAREKKPIVDREAASRENGDGPRFYLVSMVPLGGLDAAGEELGTILILKEITERKRQEVRLAAALAETARAHDRIAGIVASVDDPLFVVDGDDRLVLMNDSAQLFFACPCRDIAGLPLEAAISDPVLLAQVRRVLGERRGGAHFDFRRTVAGAQRHTFQMRTSVIGDDNGDYEGMIFLVQDVTEQREMDRLKSEFIATAAHELRTPLATILGYAELLRDHQGFSAEEQQEFLGMVAEKAESLGELLDDLLDLSRIESGKPLELKREAQPVAEVIEPEVAAFRRHYPGCSFDCDLRDAHLLIDVDRNRLRQVLENLLSNAVKYSSASGTIRVHGEKAGQGYRVTVEDEGLGMSPEQVRRAFEKFYRGAHSESTIPGSGLGLAIVENIIAAHGGSVWIESRPASGTKVRFELPLAAGQGEGSRSAAQESCYKGA